MTAPTDYPSVTAKARFVRVSPTKARRVIDLVRGKTVADALDILRWAPQAASVPVAKVIASAAANAQNNSGLDPSTLVVATVFADDGPTFKRIRPRAQGRAFRIRKRTSHITVVVESRPGGDERRGRSASAARARRAEASKAAASKKAAGPDDAASTEVAPEPAKKAPANKAPAKKASAAKGSAKKAPAKKEAADEADNKTASASEASPEAASTSEEAKGGSQ